MPLQGLPAPHRLDADFGVTYLRSQVQLEGDYKICERSADSGPRTRYHCCPTCGSNLRSESERKTTLSEVAGGALDNFDLSPTSAIFEETIFEEWMLSGLNCRA
jgi:hypothetical protein